MKPEKIEKGKYNYRGKIIEREYCYDSWSGRGHVAWTYMDRYGRAECNTRKEAMEEIDREIKRKNS